MRPRFYVDAFFVYFFVKNVSMKDKRMKVYRLNDDSKVSVESWLEGRKKLYES